MNIIKIYMLFNPTINNSKKYIGSTKLSLKTRLSQHKNKLNRTRSKQLFENDPSNVRIVLIEECCDELRAERERYHIELHDNLVNKNVPCSSDGDRAKNKAIAMKKYFQSHKLQWNLYQKERYKIKNIAFINVNKLQDNIILSETQN